jgi:hypothetical protein
MTAPCANLAAFSVFDIAMADNSFVNQFPKGINDTVHCCNAALYLDHRHAYRQVKFTTPGSNDAWIITVNRFSGPASTTP